MSTLRQGLNLDKTLASRLHRFASAGDPLEALALGPGVPGFQMLLQSLSNHPHLTKADIASFQQALDQLQTLQLSFPDGRRGMDAALAAWLPHTQPKGLRRARQQIYQATLFLLGADMETAYEGYIYAPSKTDPSASDCLLLEVRHGIRRAREGGRLILTGVPYVIASPDKPPSNVRIETWQSAPITDSALPALLPEFCSPGLTGLQAIPRGGQYLLAVGPESPPVGEPISVALGVIGRNLVPRNAEGPVTHIHNSIVLRKAARRLIVDVAVDRSLRLAPPTVSVSMAAAGPAPRSPHEDDLGSLPLADEFSSFGALALSAQGALPAGTAGRVSTESLPRLPQMLAAAINTLHPHATFDLYRLVIEYPIPHSRHLIWLQLPAPAPSPQQ